MNSKYKVLKNSSARCQQIS